MASAPRSVLVLGSTGSIGRQALEVISATPGMSVAGLAAHADVDGLLQQAEQSGVRLLALGDERRAAEARERLGSLTAGRSTGKTLGDARVFAGDEGVEELIEAAAAEAQAGGAELIVLNAVVGAAGLRATLATLRGGITLALANKESLVAGGPFVLEAARRGGARILPVDSEHSAIFQLLEGERPQAIEEILLTGSGGPFRGRSRAELHDVTADDALRHPTWVMGPKITIDSATLMNKGLEVIEAHYLFGVPYERVTVVIHPQSIVHSLVRFADGALLAHLGVPDMRVPIGYALSYPGARRPAHGGASRPLEPCPHLRATRHGDVPLPCARLRGRQGRRSGARRAERRQRGGRARLPRRADRLPRHRCAGRGSPRRARRLSVRLDRRRIRRRRSRTRVCAQEARASFRVECLKWMI